MKKAALIAEKLSKATTLEASAAIYKQPVGTAGADSTLTFSSQIINGLGNEPKVIGAAFNKELQSKISEPISGTNGVYVIKVNSIGNMPPEPSGNLVMQSAQQTKGLLQQLSGWFESLKKTADIKDNRSKQF